MHSLRTRFILFFGLFILLSSIIMGVFSAISIINTGVAGGISDGLDIGDVVIGTYLVQHDFDVTVLGYAKGYMCTGIEKDKPTKYYCDKELVEKFQSCLEQNMSKQKIHLGIIASGDKFISGKEIKKEINEYFGAVAVEMEGCAVAQVATRNKIPFVVTRAISDLADGKTAEYQNEFEKKMSEVSTQTIKIFLKNLQ